MCIEKSQHIYIRMYTVRESTIGILGMASMSSPSRTHLAFTILLSVILLTSSTAADEDRKVTLVMSDYIDI